MLSNSHGKYSIYKALNQCMFCLLYFYYSYQCAYRIATKANTIPITIITHAQTVRPTVTDTLSGEGEST